VKKRNSQFVHRNS